MALTQDRDNKGLAPDNCGMDRSAPDAPVPLSEGAARRAARMATPRLQREVETIAAMLRIYCRDHHSGAEQAEPGLCRACADSLEYSRKRLAGCPFGPEKPTCTNCQIHCFGPRQREQTRVVMRYAGPRMMLRHPILAITHVLDGYRPAPPKPRGRAAATAAEASASPPAPVKPGG